MMSSDAPREGERLQKYLARCGVASRRACEEYITAGRVSINDVVSTELGVRVVEGRDVVTVDGVVVTPPREHVYYVLHKPAGYVTTLDDPESRATVAELFPQDGRRLFTVGRLDRDTTGLLLLTDDGEFANRLMHPRYHVSKSYVARVTGTPGESDLARLRRGVELDDGPTRPAEVERLVNGAGWTDVRITISEGRKRQVRRMFSHIHHPVMRLHRECFGPVTLGTLAEGAVRPLEESEVRALLESATDDGGA
ncbi:MAG: pseudouridine synthase [Coriobacteriia bacterium]|nr:pseudouridine synthase [Coriobacteriia bacterium]